MPRAGLLREMAVHEHPVPTPTNALGAKGVGESGCSGSLPALVNATIDALRPLGIDASRHAVHAVAGVGGDSGKKA